MVNASTWGLMLTGRLVANGDKADIAGLLRKAVGRLGAPVIRATAPASS